MPRPAVDDENAPTCHRTGKPAARIAHKWDARLEGRIGGVGLFIREAGRVQDTHRAGTPD